MKRRVRRRYNPKRRRKTTTRTRPSRRGTIRKKLTSTPTTVVLKPTYFSLLADVEHALKVDHTEGASLQKLKQEMEQKYGGKKFDMASNKMFQSAIKRLRNKNRIAKIHPNSSLFKFKTPIVPNYNFFVPPPVGSNKHLLSKPKLIESGKQSTSTSRSMTTMSRSGFGMSRSMTSRSISQSTTRGSTPGTTMGSMSRSGSRSGSRSMSRSPISITKPTSRALSVRKPMSRALSVRKPTSRALSVRKPTSRALSVRKPTSRALSVRKPKSSTKRSRRPIRRRRY